MWEWIGIILYILLWIVCQTLYIILVAFFLGLTINHFINGEIFMGSLGVVVLITAYHWAFKPVEVSNG